MDPRLTGSPRADTNNKDAGVTLIELLVVTAILSALAVGVSLTTFRGSISPSDSDLAWFQNQFEIHRALAIQERRTRGVSITPNGMPTAVKTPDSWESKQPARAWRGKVTLGRSNPTSPFGTPDIVFLANGQTTAFDLVFSGGQGPARRCQTNGWTELQCGGN